MSAVSTKCQVPGASTMAMEKGAPVAQGSTVSGNTLWGRRSHVSFLSGILSMAIVVGSPVFVFFIFISLQNFDGSILNAVSEILSSSFMDFSGRFCPQLTLEAGAMYAGWVIFQAVLYAYLPGNIVHGARTPGGSVLPYKINGLLSFAVTMVGLLMITIILGLDATASVAENWGSLLVAANIYGLAASVLAWAKGHLLPTCRSNLRHSGSIWHDFLSGTELNPRIGEWDLKFLHIGRLGMNSWMLIDISYATQQFLRFGSVSNSMLIVLALHAVYVVDFFVNEAWYLRTIDIAHDHFGYYLAWGSTVWLPHIYTLQAQYLSSNPVHLSSTKFCVVLGLGILGYIFFRLANHQKHLVRSQGVDNHIDGREQKVIESQYTTASGEVHKSVLLCSGCWGISRHPNYVGDLLFSFSVCACCGWRHFIPYIYFVFMSIVLVHRCLRDEKRCLAKHGKAWEEYRSLVRWRMIPGIF